VYKEVVKGESFSLTEIIFGVIAVFLFLISVNMIGQMYHTKRGIIDISTLLFLTFGLYYLIRRALISYKYVLIGEEFIVYQRVGSKEKVALDIHVDQIQKIEKTQQGCFDEDKKKNYKRKIKLQNGRCKQNGHYAVYQEDGENHLFFFAPSEKMIRLIKERKNDKKC
jgi:hypothetical protein